MENNSQLQYNVPFEISDFKSKSAIDLLISASKLNQLVKNNLFDADGKTKIKIAILSSSTSNLIADLLKLRMYASGIIAEIYEAPFNSIFNEILDTGSFLYKFAPDYIIILTHHSDIKNFPSLFANTEEINDWLKQTSGTYINLLEALKNNLTSHILFSLFISPPYRYLGNLETKYLFSATNLYRQLNLEIISSARKDITLLDIDFLASKIGKENWFDDAAYFTSKYGQSLKATKEIASLAGSIIESSMGRIRKCLIIDLDNTLWGGIIGDDGIEGINLDINNPIGEAYLHFQRYLLKLKERGVIIAICSKNDMNLARAPFEKHSAMILKENDISCWMVNWENKPPNIIRIAQELNLELNSFVFFDDNPAEREFVKKSLPEIYVIDVPDDPALFVKTLDESCAFEWLQLSIEDTKRTESYVAVQNMDFQKSNFLNYDEYLLSLEMTARISALTDKELPRFTQLINKTNQFNIRTKRYSESQISGMMNNTGKYSLLCISLKDKFFNYGIISSVILEIKDKELFIDTWVLSCRVFKRGLEFAIFNYIIDLAKEMHIKTINGEFKSTEKNKIIENLFTELGFEPLHPTTNNEMKATSSYFLKIENARHIKHNITVTNS